MVSIIKNQLLKHLSRYTKNLSSDKINISTFRGEGELSNLQLDENVLTDLLELPAWLRLTSAWCNHVSFRISWTKLKSVPITLYLDEVNITVETCEVERTVSSYGLQSISAPQGKYSFIHKVIDGITVIVNTVNVNFKSPTFIASVQMSRIRVESKTPKWLQGDLRVTRLKDPARGLILIFKELSWQTVRIEASSTQDKTLTPLRLLTNQARCRMTIKKKLSDCSILASRLVLILDDLLWVLTDSQLKAALYFVDSLANLIKASTYLTQKSKAQKKLESLPEYQAQQAQQSSQNDPVATTTPKPFTLFDVRETSYHFFSQRIDLHFCDDPGDGRSCHPDLKSGGALQVSIQGFQIDYFPFHLAKSDRNNWPKYREASVPPALWLEQSLTAYKESLMDLSQSFNSPSERIDVQSPSVPNVSSATKMPIQSDESPSKSKLMEKLNKLMTSCVVMRIEDFTFYRVTTAGRKQMPKEFITGDKDRYSFPAEISTLHAEFTYFYFPGDIEFPVPPNKIYAHVNPIQINFHLDSILWFNSFALNLHKSLMRTSVGDSTDTNKGNNVPTLMYMDVKLEALMPRIIFECLPDAPVQRDRPKILQAQISRFSLTNMREPGSSKADLAQALQSLQEGSLIFASDFPSKSGDFCVITDRILSHVAATDVSSTKSSPDKTLPHSILSNVSRYALWSEPRDVWCIKIDPVWADFLGARSVGLNKAVPFIDAVPVSLWIHGNTNEKLMNTSISSLSQSQNVFATFKENMESNKISGNRAFDSQFQYSTDMPRDSSFFENENTVQNEYYEKSNVIENTDSFADIHIIAHISNLVSLQIDHFQYLFLLRLLEEITELSTFISLDTNRILEKQSSDKSIVIGCVVPQVEVTLVMPSQIPGKESSGGDVESVLPDSASLGEDLHFNNPGAWSTQFPLDHNKVSQNGNPFGSVEIPSPVSNELPKDDFHQHTSNPNTHGYNVHIMSTSAVTQSGPAVSSKVKKRNSVTDTSLKDFGSSLISMKKGFSNFMTSIDSVLKPTTSDDVSDSYSIQSDLSSDSENYFAVSSDDKTADCIDVMFRLNPFITDNNQLKASPVELASEVCEEPNFKTNMSSPSEPSEATSWKRRDLVSMATFRLTTVEMIRQSCGQESSLRLQVSAINCDECGAIPWDELQTKFGARCRSWNLATYNPEASPCLQLRLDEVLNPPTDFTEIIDKRSVLKWFQHNMEIHIKDLNMDLSMSTIVGLGDLVEDEIIPKPVPLEILLDNLKLNLMEDRPPVNITSPGPVPINLQIEKLKIIRDETGVFQIQSMDLSESTSSNMRTPPIPEKANIANRDRELLSMQLVMQQLKIDNETLKKQLSTKEKSMEISKMKIKQENEILKNSLRKAQDSISQLLEEKQALLNSVRSLEVQLLSLENNKLNNEKR